jgi:archaemetzincin
MRALAIACVSVLGGCEAVALTAELDEDSAELAAMTALGDVAAGTRGTVLIVELGPFPDDLKAHIEDALRDELQVEVKHLDSMPLPKSAYYKPRHRWRADTILDVLNEEHGDEPATTRVLALTASDISVTKEPFADWGIFGLANSPGEAAVVSMFRLKRKAKDRAHLKFRLASVAVHEVGHTFGLPHCEEEQCAMLDAEGGIANTDTGTGKLGPSCRARLDDAFPITPTSASSGPTASTIR